MSIADSAGVPSSYAQNTLVAPYNDPEAVAQFFQHNPAGISAVIVEPVAANMGVVPPHPGFLDRLRQLTREFGALLIFDEVITGFRVAYGGAQGLYGITPDLTCLGKIIGGGLPVGAYGGRREIMEMIAPLGPVYQAGTLSGNPLVMTAGIETIKLLGQPGVYEQLEVRSSALAEGIEQVAARAGITRHVSRVASLLTLFFSDQPVTDYQSASQSDTIAFGRFFRDLLSQGIYWPPSQFEAAFVSLAHSDRDIQTAIEAVDRSLAHQAG
jgi:glutamate-1-semialdehyde 2,1-aminomutase